MSKYIPTVVESGEKGERAFDLYSRMLRDRIIFIQGGIDTDMANNVVAQLLFLEAEDPKADITIYIHSPGGCIASGMSIVDTIQMIKPDVVTIITGYAASMGSIIAVSGTKGKRFALKNAQHMIHQPLTGVPPHTQATDIQITHEHIQMYKEKLTKHYADHTTADLEWLKTTLERDYWMQVDECLERGFIDKIL
tara:strand:- start:4511 stop:5092 length:582 start_codon:yes stop_codon:yes gene_type:complete